MDCHKNMAKCIHNTRSVKGFWQYWHGSFNRWLVRYIYIPLGGSKQSIARQVCNTFCVFTFVAVWHDLSPQLFVWGWLLVLFFVPEMAALRFARSPAGKDFARRHPLVVDRFETLGGALCIFMLKLACLIGYGYALDGAGNLMAALSTPQALAAMTLYTMWMYSMVRLIRLLEIYRAQRRPEEAAPAHNE